MFLALVVWSSKVSAQQEGEGERFTESNWEYRILSAEEKTVALVAVPHYDYYYEVENKVATITLPSNVEHNGNTFTVTEIDLNGSFPYISSIDEIIMKIPNTVKTIADMCFYDVRKLKSVELPASLTKIGFAAFAGTGLTSIELPVGLKDIGRYAFQANGLKEITIPKNVSYVAGCLRGNLETIRVDEENATYDSRGDCNAIVHTASNTLAAGCWGTTIPSDVAVIGPYAFYDVGFYKREFVLPDWITDIGDHAFASCRFYQPTFSIPETVRTIGEGAFSFSDIETAPASGSLKSVGAYAFSCTRVKHAEIMPDVEYGAGAFNSCWSLKSIHLSKDVSAIADRMFMGCDSLTEVRLPQSLQRIGHLAFAASKLRQVEGLSSYRGELGVMAFNACDSLMQITLPEDHPLYYTSDDGKVIYTRQGELRTLLPSVSKLIIPYPATGICTEEIPLPFDTAHAQFCCPLNCGSYFQLDTLGLPCTWKAPIMQESLFGKNAYGAIDYSAAKSETIQVPITGQYNYYQRATCPTRFLARLRLLSVRCAKPFPFDDACLKAGSDSIKMFAYAIYDFRTYKHADEGAQFQYSRWQRVPESCYSPIELPYSEMYVQEVVPMLGETTATTDDGLVYWTAD